ncbi:MAG: hypothetical protein IJG59_01170 [Erysipelotrichaceae bacterium]|nr:hypothetical protein [Erysipelotrichaceae bacterium]
MENRLTGRILIFIFYISISITLIRFAPNTTGILIFGFFLMMAKFRNTDKILAVHDKAENPEKESHQRQITYSHRYSMKKRKA